MRNTRHLNFVELFMQIKLIIYIFCCDRIEYITVDYVFFSSSRGSTVLLTLYNTKYFLNGLLSNTGILYAISPRGSSIRKEIP